MAQNQKSEFLKYFGAIDSFIKISKVKGLPFPNLPRNRNEFFRTVLDSCIEPSELRSIKRKLRKQGFGYSTDVIEDLYALCASVNPEVSIDSATIELQPIQNSRSLQEKESCRSTDFSSLEKRISSSIIGQGEVVSTVVKTLRKAELGIRRPYKPKGNFLFAGRTGVGKTELAKVLAREMGCGFMQINGSDYSLPHEHSKLIGAPPGYIGHGEGGLLKMLKSRPDTIVLWDEIEKAHLNTHNILLQILDEGKTMSSNGEGILFNKAVNILTTNTGVDDADKTEQRMTFEQRKGLRNEEFQYAILSGVSKTFKPEWINRLDAVCVFNELRKKDCLGIANLQLGELKRTLSGRGIDFLYTPTVIGEIVNRSDYKTYGAREISRIIAKSIEDGVVDILESGKKVSRIFVGYKDKFYFETL